jgi:hypothetical protein
LKSILSKKDVDSVKTGAFAGNSMWFWGGIGEKTLSPIKIPSETEKVRYFRNCEYTSRGDENIGKCLNCVLLFGILGGCFLGVF